MADRKAVAWEHLFVVGNRFGVDVFRRKGLDDAVGDAEKSLQIPVEQEKAATG